MESNRPSGLTIVYRTLRRISKWTLAFYSEVYVTGEENVPTDGPVLLYVLFVSLGSLRVLTAFRIRAVSHAITMTVSMSLLLVSRLSPNDE